MDEPLLKPEVDPPVRLWRQTSWLLNQVTARANRLVAEHFGSPGGRMRYAILAGLDQFGALSQAELCRRLGIDRGDAVSGLNALQRDGLILRAADPRDGRRNTVHITRQGSEVLLELDVMVDSAQSDLLQSLQASERVQLNSLLRRIIERSEPRRSGESKAENRDADEALTDSREWATAPGPNLSGFSVPQGK